MSLMGPMTPGEAEQQTDMMCKFISTRGKESSDEIDQKTEEEYQHEKMRMIQAETEKIDLAYSRRFKLLEVQKKISASTDVNTARVQVLKSQDTHLEEIYSKARQKISDVVQDKKKYTKLMQGLITQGLLALLEKNVTIRSRMVDFSLVKQVLPDAVREYTEICKKPCNVVLDEQNSLPDSCGGGVELIVSLGKIKVSNTLSNRLDTGVSQVLPVIRNQLFGVTGTRAFFD